MKAFDPQIYPRKLYVLDSLEELELFEGREGGSLEVPSDKTVDASVWSCLRKDNNTYCVVVCFHQATIENLAHESIHIANSIFQDCQVDFDYHHDEHYAYFVGWIAKCLGEALNVKLIKDKKK